MKILVTVGMGDWPFDRLLRGVVPLCEGHEVFAQTGTSRVDLSCERRPFISFDEMLERIASADLVITHAGNTVRLVQRQGKLPIAAAREARFREMANDHQVLYLRREEALGRVVAAWRPESIADIVARRSEPWRQETPVPASSACEAASILTRTWRMIGRNPFRSGADRHLAFAWAELASRSGRHLHFGSGGQALQSALSAASSALEVSVRPAEALPAYGERESDRFDSISFLDTAAPDAACSVLIGRARDMLSAGGLLVVACRRHVLGSDPVGLLQSCGLAPVRWESAGSDCLLSVRLV